MVESKYLRSEPLSFISCCWNVVFISSCDEILASVHSYWRCKVTRATALGGTAGSCQRLDAHGFNNDWGQLRQLKFLGRWWYDSGLSGVGFTFPLPTEFYRILNYIFEGKLWSSRDWFNFGKKNKIKDLRPS